ncbi:glycoside hydrolase family 99-like domain-containing protein [Bacteroidota bacterium]
MADQMNKSIKTISILISVFAFVFPSCNKSIKKDISVDEYYVAAYIWPSCHNDDRGREVLWPEGTGEWEIIKKGTPRFEGHYQPKVPLWGYEMDDDPEVMERWIDIATAHGVNVFIFDWYWFDGEPFLESSLNNGFLKAKNNEKMQFYVMWANHDVKENYWNHYKYDSDSLLWKGATDWENYKIIVDRIITQYFHQPNYFKIDGKPVFSIFSIWNFLESFASLENAMEAVDYFREETRKAGFPGLHLQMVGFGASDWYAQQVKSLGVNSVTKYNWGGPHPEDYIKWGVQGMKQREMMDRQLDVPFFPNTSIGWDDTPRFPEKGKSDLVHYNQSPESFAAFLQKSKDYLDQHPDQTKLMTIYAWNEWVEGAYLLPDMNYGFSYLDALKDVLDGKYDK